MRWHFYEHVDIFSHKYFLNQAYCVHVSFSHILKTMEEDATKVLTDQVHSPPAQAQAVETDWPDFDDKHLDRVRLASMPVIDDDGMHKFAYYVIFRLQAQHDSPQHATLESVLTNSGVPFRLSFVNELQEMRLHFYLSLYDYKTHFHDYLQAQGLSLTLIDRPCNAYTREYQGSDIQIFLFLVIVSSNV